MSSYFNLYGNIFVVKGNKESIIYDLGNQNYYSLPNDIADVLLKIEKEELSIDKLRKIYGKKYNDVKKLLKYFVEKNLAQFVSNPKSFPKIGLEWHSPYKIVNAIVEFNNACKYNVIEVLHQLEALGCQAIEFRFIDKLNKDYISKILDEFLNSSFKYYLIASKYNENISTEKYKTFAYKYKRISRLLVFVENSVKFYDKLKKSQPSKPKVIFINRNLGFKMGEKITLNSFVINIPSFAEARSHNIGLNRKVCIDSNGDIRNFLTHRKTYGNVNDEKIKDIIDLSNFQYKWNISNNKIQKCKDCQYRYMCLSNSDIIEKNGKFYKVDICNFNPYTNKWE